MHIEEIINRFEKVKKIGDKSYQCLCKSHADKNSSLTITEEDNKIFRRSVRQSMVYEKSSLRYT